VRQEKARQNENADWKRKARMQDRARQVGMVRRCYYETEKRADRQSKLGSKEGSQAVRQVGRQARRCSQSGQKREAQRGKQAGLGRKADKKTGRGRQA
jgi:hypothetical protein